MYLIHFYLSTLYIYIASRSLDQSLSSSCQPHLSSSLVGHPTRFGFVFTLTLGLGNRYSYGWVTILAETNSVASDIVFCSSCAAVPHDEISESYGVGHPPVEFSVSHITHLCCCSFRGLLGLWARSLWGPAAWSLAFWVVETPPRCLSETFSHTVVLHYS